MAAAGRVMNDEALRDSSHEFSHVAKLRAVLNELHWENIAHTNGSHSNDDDHVQKAEAAILHLIADRERVIRPDSWYQEQLAESINKFDQAAALMEVTVERLEAVIADRGRMAILGLHDSIMRGELPLGAETDQAFNYARIHRWIDLQAALTNKSNNERQGDD